MRRLTALLLLSFWFASPPAHAVIKGSASSAYGRYTVRLVGNDNCSGVIIARNAVATAGHCARGMHVIAGGESFQVIGISRTAVLDDGRRVSVSGDAAILRLAAPLPADLTAAEEVDGNGIKIVKWIGQRSFVHDFTIPGRRARIWDDHSKSWYPPQSPRRVA